MKKNKIIIFIMLISLCGVLFVACKDNTDLPPGSQECFAFSVKNVEDLRVVFGKDFIYSNTGKMFDAEVESDHPDNLYLKKDKVEFIEELQRVGWKDKFNDFEIITYIYKNKQLSENIKKKPMVIINDINCYKIFSDEGLLDCGVSYRFEYNEAIYDLVLYVPTDEYKKTETLLYEQAMQGYIAQLS